MICAAAAIVLADPLLFVGARAPIADTFLDQQNPDQNYGRDMALVGGKDKGILIRHNALHLEVPAGHKITDAKLHLTLMSGKPNVEKVDRMIRDWFEGPERGDRKEGAEAPALASTWNGVRRGVGWNGGGAKGAQDVTPVSGWSATIVDQTLTISGLGPAFQEMLDSPLKNGGLRLSMDSYCAFVSTENMVFGPQIELTTEPSGEMGPDLFAYEAVPSSPGASDWTLTIQNRGTADSAGAQVQFLVDGELKSETALEGIKVGGERRVTANLPIRINDTDHRLNELQVRVVPAGPDADSRNDVMRVPMQGIPVALDQRSQLSDDLLRRAVDRLNSHLFPFSRTSFARGGTLERVRFVSSTNDALVMISEEKAQSLNEETLAFRIVEALVGFSRTKDTRDDGLLLSMVPMTDLSWPDRLRGQAPLPEQKLIGRAEVAVLQHLIGKVGDERDARTAALPAAVLIRMFDPGGQTISDAAVSIQQAVRRPDGSFQEIGEVLGEEEVIGGSLILTPSSLGRDSFFGDLAKDLSNGWLLLKITKNGAETVYPVSWHRLAAEALRNPGGSANLEARVMLASNPVDWDRNMTADAAAEDSLDHFPAQIQSLFDEDAENATGIQIPGGSPYWLDIDIGRDRLIGAIVLEFEGTPWDELTIRTYQTGQRVAQARTWIREIDAPSRAQVKNGRTVLSYVTQTAQARYIRIETAADRPVKLLSVKIHPAKRKS
jgi:hypothetical protein